MLMFGWQPIRATTLSQVAYDSSSYSAHLRAKHAELQEFVKTNLTAAASNQKLAYKNHTLVEECAAMHVVNIWNQR